MRRAVEEHLGFSVQLTIKHLEDFRNYKVSVEKAENVLSFHPDHNVKSIVGNLVKNMDKFQDWDNPLYYNILALKAMDRETTMAQAGMVTT